MDGDDAIADEILEQFQFGEYSSGHELLADTAPIPAAKWSPPPPSSIFDIGLGNQMHGARQTDVASCHLVDLLLLQSDVNDRDRLGMVAPDDVDQFPAFLEKPWLPEIKDELLESRMQTALHPVIAKTPAHLIHHQKRQAHHQIRNDRVQEPFNWSRIHDPVRRKKIERWKQKRDRIRSGLTVKHVYDVRVQHAIKRPRTGGRFVSATAQSAMLEASTQSRHDGSTTTA